MGAESETPGVHSPTKGRTLSDLKQTADVPTAHPDASAAILLGVLSVFIFICGPFATWRAIRGLNSFDPATHTGKGMLITGLVLSMWGNLGLLVSFLLLLAPR